MSPPPRGQRPRPGGSTWRTASPGLVDGALAMLGGCPLGMARHRLSLPRCLAKSTRATGGPHELRVGCRRSDAVASGTTGRTRWNSPLDASLVHPTIRPRLGRVCQSQLRDHAHWPTVHSSRKTATRSARSRAQALPAHLSAGRRAPARVAKSTPPRSARGMTACGSGRRRSLEGGDQAWRITRDCYGRKIGEGLTVVAATLSAILAKVGT